MLFNQHDFPCQALEAAWFVNSSHYTVKEVSSAQRTPFDLNVTTLALSCETSVAFCRSSSGSVGSNPSRGRVVG
jgi:hypothetical protein